jgi:hypothetical protein
MDEKKDNAGAKAYRITITTLKPVDKETGKRPEGRDVVLDVYGFSGNLPEGYVDYGNYWDEDGDGYLELRTGEGREVVDLVRAMEYVDDYGFRDVKVPRPEELGADRRWFEVPVPGSDDGRLLRVELLDELPKLDADRTRADSELSLMAQHRVKINGVPLFRDGDVRCGEALRTDFGDVVDEMWRARIKERGGVDVGVKVVPTPCGREFTVTAKSRDDLRAALRALGVRQPEKIVPSVEYGDWSGIVEVVAKVTVVERIAG